MMKLPSPIIAMLSATLFLTGCGGGTGIQNHSGTENNSSTLASDTSSLSFGIVPTGSSKTASITLKNTSSNLSVTVSKLSLTGSQFEVSSSLSTPFTLNAQQSTIVGISFSPTSGGTASGTLAISSDAAAAPMSIALSGQGQNGSSGTVTLYVTPQNAVFGNVLVGSNSTVQGVLTATAATNVTSVQVNGSAFSIGGLALPASLSPGDQLTFTATFTPSSAGPATGTATFQTDNGAIAVEDFSGVGVSSANATVALSWQASPSPAVGYNVYRGITNGGPFNDKLTASPVTQTQYLDADVVSGQTYYYVTTAVNSSGQESTNSNMASAVIP